MKDQVLVIGANGGIGAALCQYWRDKGYDVTAVSRSASKVAEIESVVCDMSKAQIALCVAKWQQRGRQFRYIVIATGVLHGEHFSPEKKLADFDVARFLSVIDINAALPMLWIQNLSILFNNHNDVTMAVLSARVGSINDNRLGGWYSYRASKSALNMLLSCANLELNRHRKNVKLLAFHPGTTDTKLSKPFQANVKADKLFSATFVAQQLHEIMRAAPIDGLFEFLDWQGKAIEF